MPLAIRKEVLDFVRSSEVILASALRTPALTKDERELLAEYAAHVSRSVNHL
jgi:hypothetical protein